MFVLAEQITVDGRVLSGVDRFGDWRTTDFEGWWDSPERKGNDEEQEAADGSFDSPAFASARVITISGRVRSASHEDQHEAGQWLTSALARGSGVMLVKGHGADQWARVKLDAKVRFTPLTDTYAQWQVRLRAPNPRKFGATHELFVPHSTQTWLQHYGNYPAAPVFNLTGASATSGYDVRGPSGAIFTVTQPLVAGQSHRVDMRTGSLFVGGVLTHGKVSRADTFEIEPGATGSVVRLVAPTGSVIATASVTDTFI